MGETGEQLIYHYTDDKGVRGIIESQSIWATHYRYLNDTKELLIFREAFVHWRKTMNSQIQPVDHYWRELLNSVLGGSKETPVTEAYIASFCDDEGDRLSQWRAYGKGGGYALGFDEAELQNMLNEEHKSYRLDTSFIGPVYYGNRVRLPKETSDGLMECQDILIDRSQNKEHNFEKCVLLFMKSLSTFKHEGFSEEKEKRLIVFVPAFQRNGEEDSRVPKSIKFRSVEGVVVPYIELFQGKYQLPIRRITVGPSPDSERSQRALQILLQTRGMDPKMVTISQIPYRGS